MGNNTNYSDTGIYNRDTSSSSNGNAWRSGGDTTGGGGGGQPNYYQMAGNLIGGVVDHRSARKANEKLVEGYSQLNDDIRLDANYASEMTDPYQAYRGQHAADLSAIMSGEKDFRTDPGYQFRMDEAMRETERGAAARGFNRSGNVMASMNTRAQEVASAEYGNIINRLTNLAGATPQNAIGGGQVYGQMLGDAHSAQSGSMANAAAGASGGGMSDLLGGIGSMMSDIRLKKDVTKVEDREGYTWYTWTWNELAEPLGLTGTSEGVIANELQETHPELVTTNESGYLQVNYGGLV